MDFIWLLEHRSFYENTKVMVCTVAGVFTTKEKALDFIARNKDYDDSFYWWYLGQEVVDPMEDEDHAVCGFFIFDSKGKELASQPTYELIGLDYK